MQTLWEIWSLASFPSPIQERGVMLFFSSWVFRSIQGPIILSTPSVLALSEGRMEALQLSKPFVSSLILSIHVRLSNILGTYPCLRLSCLFLCWFVYCHSLITTDVLKFMRLRICFIHFCIPNTEKMLSTQQALIKYLLNKSIGSGRYFL